MAEFGRDTWIMSDSQMWGRAIGSASAIGCCNDVVETEKVQHVRLLSHSLATDICSF